MVPSLSFSNRPRIASTSKRRSSWRSWVTVMFDRAFFERQFPDQLQHFCREQKIAAPVVELLLDDGTVLRPSSIAQIKESWLAFSTYSESGEARLLLCPYFSIKRISFSAPSADTDLVFSLSSRP